jgi:hypothetical protein
MSRRPRFHAWAGLGLSLPLLVPTASLPLGRSFPSPADRLSLVEPAILRHLRLGAPIPPSRPVRLHFLLAAQPGLSTFANEVSTPGSPLYRHFLSPQALLHRFGPPPSRVQADIALLRRLGYRHVRQDGWMLSAQAPAQVVDRTLSLHLRYVSQGVLRGILPDQNPLLPRGLTGVAALTGLARVEWRPASFRPARTHLSPRPAQTTLPAGYTASAVVEGPSQVPTGLPITVQLVVHDPSGQPDARAVAEGISLSGSGTLSYRILGPDGDGHLNLTFSSNLPGTYLPTATVDLAPVAVPIPAADLPPSGSVPSPMVATFTAGGTVYASVPVPSYAYDGALWNDLYPSAGHGVAFDPPPSLPPGTYTVELSFPSPQGTSILAEASYTLPVADPVVSVDLPSVTFTGDAAQPGPIGPTLLDTALDAQGLLTAATSHPRTVGLIAMSAPYPGDLSSFETQNGLPPSQVTVRPVDGGESAVVHQGYTSELSLDMEAVATAAPGAHLVLYTLPPTGDLLDALTAAVQDGKVQVFSLSIVGFETLAAGQSYARAFAQQVQAAAAEGISVVAASGDWGALGPSGQGEVSFPANLAQVTGVGGVDLRMDAQGSAVAVAAWGGNAAQGLDSPYVVSLFSSHSFGMTGGGYSLTQPVPAWQASFLPPGATGRGVPDVAMPASSTFPGITWTLDGQSSVSGGTSLAAPLFAGFLADIASLVGPLGDVNPSLYALAALEPSTFHQALYGSDARYTVSSSSPWNPLTGLGLPDVGSLWQGLAGLGSTSPQPASLTTDLTQPTVVPAGVPLTVTFIARSAMGLRVPGVKLTVTAQGTLAEGALTAMQLVTGPGGEATVTYLDRRPGDQGTFTARVAQGSAQVTTAPVLVTSPLPRGMVRLWVNGQPVEVRLPPGLRPEVTYRLRLSVRAWRMALVLPPISVYLTPQGQAILGQAPPQAPSP